MSAPAPPPRNTWLSRPWPLLGLGLGGVAGILLWFWYPLAQPPGTRPDPDRVASAPASLPPPASLPVSLSNPTPNNPIPNNPILGPRFDIARIGADGNAVIAGQAQPHAQVTILDGEQPIGEAQADARGAFVFLPATPLPPGTRALRLRQRSPDGTQTQGSEQVILSVPLRPAAAAPASSASAPQTAPPQTAPPQMAPPQMAPPQALALLTAPNATPRLLQTPLSTPPAATSAARMRLGLDLVDYDASGDIRFAGSAPAGASVRVYVNNQPLGTTTADAAGKWSFQAPGLVPAGDHLLRLDHLAPGGEVSARVELLFRREAQLTLPAVILSPGADPASAGGLVVVQPGDSLWLLARHNYGEGLRYTAIHAANRAHIRDPNLIYPGQIFAIPKADPAGPKADPAGPKADPAGPKSDPPAAAPLR